MRCSERGMWQKTREIARYDERDEPEQGNKGMERHGNIMERSKKASLKAQWYQKRSYIITHLWLFFFSFSFFADCGGVPGSMFLVCRRERTRFMKSRSTFCAVLADVSRNSQPNWRAIAAPSSLETSRSYVLSHLLPTSMNMGSPRLTLRIDWRNISSRSKVDREAIE